MMRSFTPLSLRLGKTFCLFTALSLLLFGMLPDASGRVGDSPEQLERRLTSAGGISIRDQEVREHRMRGAPYLRIMDQLPGSVEVRLYFKTADGRRPMSSELRADRQNPGWDVHALFVNGRAVLVYYKRSQGITEEEFNALMALQRGNGYWEAVDRGGETALGFRWQRSDGEIRANRVGGDGVLIFDTKMDQHVRTLINAERATRAPLSVEGF